MSMNEMIKNIFKEFLPDISQVDINESFENIGLESIDLVVARVKIENQLNKKIPDAEWLEFDSLSHIINFFNGTKEDTIETESKIDNPQFEQEYVVNMPQMAVESLSESWLFKELGDKHWEMLCEGLNSNSFDLADALGNRLYATFVRIRLNFSSSLFDFNENQKAIMKGAISRFGESIYFSNMRFGSNDCYVDAELMTTFSIRNASDNKKLTKSQPAPGENKIEALEGYPDFGNEYRLVKKKVLKKMELVPYDFDILEDVIFETEYELNPYYDLNGVGLLYFAAYPIINDICHARYFNEKNDDKWEIKYFTAYKDILYYANCNIDDQIIYRLHEQKQIDDHTIKITSSLFRKSDNMTMAKIFTVKKRR